MSLLGIENCGRGSGSSLCRVLDINARSICWLAENRALTISTGTNSTGRNVRREIGPPRGMSVVRQPSKRWTSRATHYSSPSTDQIRSHARNGNVRRSV